MQVPHHHPSWHLIPAPPPPPPPHTHRYRIITRDGAQRFAPDHTALLQLAATNLLPAQHRLVARPAAPLAGPAALQAAMPGMLPPGLSMPLFMRGSELDPDPRGALTLMAPGGTRAELIFVEQLMSGQGEQLMNRQGEQRGELYV